MDAFAVDECLYRGLHPMWINDDNSISSAAFKDSNGISVDRDGGRPEKECVDRIVGTLPQITGVGRLTCSDVENCGAVTIYCPTEENEFHSEIHDSFEQIQIKSKSKSRKLASMCHLVFRK